MIKQMVNNENEGEGNFQISLKPSLIIAVLLQLSLFPIVLVTKDMSVVILFTSMICILLGIIFLQLRDVSDRVLYVIGVGLLPPFMTIKLEDFPGIFSSDWMLVLLPTDRINLPVICAMFLSLLLFLNAVHLKVLFKDRVSIIFSILLGASILIFLSRVDDFERISYYQVAADYMIILGSFSVYCLMKHSSKSLEEMMQGVHLIMGILIAILTIDMVLTIAQIVPWSVNYRNAYAGTLFGMASEYSLLLCLSVVYVIITKRSRLLVWTFYVLMALFVAYSTMIKSSYQMIVMLFLIVMFLRVLGPHLGKVILYGGIAFFVFGISFVLNNPDAVSEDFGSLMARLGSIIAPIDVATENLTQTFFGLSPGTLTVNGKSNLALAIFDFGRDSFFANSNLQGAIVDEILLRAELDEGGEMSPHVSPVAMLFSYGLISLPFIFYFWLLVPYRFLKLQLFKKSEPIHFLVFLYLYMILFSLLHPVILLSVIAFFGCLISKVIAEKTIKV